MESNLNILMNKRKNCIKFISSKEYDSTIKFSDFRNNLMILSASRSGSSLLFYILSQNQKIVALDGETTPYLNLLLKNRSDDQLNKDDALSFQKNKYFEQDLIFDIGKVVPNEEYSIFFSKKEYREKYSVDVLRRLILQQPQINWNIEKDLLTIQKILLSIVEKHSSFNILEFYLTLLNSFNIDHKGYDFQKPLKNKELVFKDKDIIEEIPFIFVKPKYFLSKEILKDHYFLMKTPSNIYRLPFWKQIFNKAKFNWIHLARNPASSINGLIDGWNSSSFQSYSPKEELNIKFNGKKILEKKWCFDLFPEWTRFIGKNLEDICLHQWKNSHQQIFKFLVQKKSFFIKFEDIIGDNKKIIFNELFKYFKLSNELNDDKLPIIQQSTKPMKFKWRNREKFILPLLKQREVSDLIDQLGYSSIIDDLSIKSNIKEDWI